MGDRITTYHFCPQCHKQMETYDAMSSLMYISKCDHCGYKDRREYFEISKNEIRLITPEQLEELKKKNSKIRKFRKWLEKLEQSQKLEYKKKKPPMRTKPHKGLFRGELIIY